MGVEVKEPVPNHWRHDAVVRRVSDRASDPAVRVALEMLVREMRSRHESVYVMLRRMDRNDDGRLGTAEIQQALIQTGVRLGHMELESVVQLFNHDCTSCRAASANG